MKLPFSSYDKYTANLDRQYNWFSIEDILRFPVEQYGINIKDLYPSNVIDFKDDIITEYPTRKITILLDKTGSIKDSKVSKIKQRLVSKLNDEIYDFEKHIDTSTIKVEDLFLLTALEQLTRDEKRNLTHIEVLIYTGSEKNIKVVNHIEKALKIDPKHYVAALSHAIAIGFEGLRIRKASYARASKREIEQFIQHYPQNALARGSLAGWHAAVAEEGWLARLFLGASRARAKSLYAEALLLPNLETPLLYEYIRFLASGNRQALG